MLEDGITRGMWVLAEEKNETEKLRRIRKAKGEREAVSRGDLRGRERSWGKRKERNKGAVRGRQEMTREMGEQKSPSDNGVLSQV